MEEKGSLVSIILVNYLDTSETLECLKSLSKLNYAPFTVVIVDNASTVRTASELERGLTALKLSGRVVGVETNLGFGAACNQGASVALTQIGADYVWFLNNDTIVHESALCSLMDAVGTNYQDTIASSLILYASDREVIWYAGATVSYLGFVKHLYQGAKLSDFKVDRIPSDFATGCSVLVSGDIWRRVGTFDERYFMYYEDTEWSFRARRHGCAIVLDPGSVVYHKVGRSVVRSWGGDSPLREFYDVRNKLLFIRSCFTPVRRTVAVLNMVFYRIPRRVLRITILGGSKRISLYRANFRGLVHGLFR